MASPDTVEDTADVTVVRLGLRHPRLPRWAPALVAVAAFAAGGIVSLVLGWGVAAWALIAAVVYLVGLPLWSRVVENARAAVDRLMTGLVWAAVVLALVPLVSLLYDVVSQGAAQINGQFLTYSMRNVLGAGGGIYHGLVGTLLITLGATVISVPIGLLTSIYLVEYGARSQMASGNPVPGRRDDRHPLDCRRAVRLRALRAGHRQAGIRIGFGGSVALSLLMIPIVVRSAEEMLKLVPMDLREALYALGVLKWRTILRVVLPATLAGIITGITLAIARVIGETAPLLIIAGSTDSVNTNLLGNQMMTLPADIYYSYTQPGLHPDIARGHAWGAAPVLIVIVMALNVFARLLGRLLAPKTGH